MINISLMSPLGYLRASNIRKIIASSSVLITILPPPSSIGLANFEFEPQSMDYDKFGGHLPSVILIILQNMER